MIAPLRRRHRLWISALAVAVPVLYVLALAARPRVPATELPAVLEAPAAGGELVREARDLFPEHAVTVRIRRGASYAVELEPEVPIVRPEILVYWSPRAADAGALPAEAFLLGTLAGTRSRTFGLPAAAVGRDGWLVLYSLGHQEVVDAGALEAVGMSIDTVAAETAGEAP